MQSDKSAPTSLSVSHVAKRNRATLLVLAGVASWTLSYFAFKSNYSGIHIALGSATNAPSFSETVSRNPYAIAYAAFGTLCMLVAGSVLYRGALRRP